MKLDKHFETMTVKELLEIVNQKTANDDVLFHLRRIFEFNIWKDESSLVTKYFLTLNRYREWAVTIQITEEIYNDFERWIKK